MTNEKIERKQNDTGPPVDDTLTTDGTADDLSGATVAFTMWNPQSGSVKVDENTSNVTIETAADGDVEYDFQAGDLDTAGTFFYEWEVTFASGEVRTYPNDRDGVTLEVIPEGS